MYLLSMFGGADKGGVLYANILAQEQHDMRLVYGTIVNAELGRQLDSRVELVALGVSRSLCAPLRLARELRMMRPQAIIVRGVSNMLPAVLAAKLGGLPAW